MYDVQQLLKRFGTFIYTGDRQLDLELMEDEIRELYKWEFVDIRMFQQALLVIRTERAQLQKDKGESKNG